jgi:hypothetical protein
MQKSRKLRNFLLFPSVQFTLILSGCVISLLTFGIIWFRLSGIFVELQSVGTQLKFSPDGGYFKLLVSQQKLIFQNLLVVGSISAAMSAMVVLVISHKILGPIYRLKKYFDLINEERGVLPAQPLAFRRHDFFRELAPIINQALASLKVNHPLADPQKDGVPSKKN